MFHWDPESDVLHFIPTQRKRRVNYIFLRSLSQTGEGLEFQDLEIWLRLTVHKLEQEVEHDRAFCQMDYFVAILWPGCVLRIGKDIGMNFQILAIDLE
jgi:hypothetical protein